MKKVRITFTNEKASYSALLHYTTNDKVSIMEETGDRKKIGKHIEPRFPFHNLKELMEWQAEQSNSKVKIEDLGGELAFWEE